MLIYHCFLCQNVTQPETPGFREWLEVRSVAGFALRTKTLRLTPGGPPPYGAHHLIDSRPVIAFGGPDNALDRFEAWILGKGDRR